MAKKTVTKKAAAPKATTKRKPTPKKPAAPKQEVYIIKVKGEDRYIHPYQNDRYCIADGKENAAEFDHQAAVHFLHTNAADLEILKK